MYANLVLIVPFEILNYFLLMFEGFVPQRKALFTWLKERKYDIIFLQETYSTVDVGDAMAR